MTSVHFVHKKNVVIPGAVIFYTKNVGCSAETEGNLQISSWHFFDNLEILVVLLHSSVPVKIL